MTIKKVLFEYDSGIGMITDSVGMSVTCVGMIPFDNDQPKTSEIDDVIKLKGAGFTAEEIVTLRSTMN